MVTTKQAHEFIELIRSGYPAQEALQQMRLLGSAAEANIQSMIQTVGNLRAHNGNTIDALRQLGRLDPSFGSQAAQYLQQIAARGGGAAAEAVDVLHDLRGAGATQALEQLVRTGGGGAGRAFEYLRQMASSGSSQAQWAMRQLAAGGGPYAAEAREVIKTLGLAAAGAGGTVGAGGGAGAGGGGAVAAGSSAAVWATIAGAVVAFLAAGYVWSQWPEWTNPTALGPAAAGREARDDTRGVGTPASGDTNQYYVVRVRGTRIYSIRSKAAVESGIALQSFRHGGTSNEIAQYDEMTGPMSRDEAVTNLANRVRGMRKPPLAAGQVGLIDGEYGTIDDLGPVGIAELVGKNPDIRGQ